MLTLDELLAADRELALGDGDLYRGTLAEDAVVVIPGAVLGREECSRAMDESPGWDEVRLERARLVPVAADSALVTYEFTGTRGEVTYRALMSSVYAVRDGARALLLHQQTPLD